MLQFKIDGYNGFKEVFGTKKSERGCISNRILLSFWKHRFKVDGDARASAITNLAELYNTVVGQLSDHTTGKPYLLKSRWQEYLDSSHECYRRTEEVRKYNPRANFRINIDGKVFNFFIKEYDPCGENPYNYAHPGMIHVYNKTNRQEMYVKAGRFLKQVMEDNEVNLDEPTKLYVQEEFQRKIDACTKFDETRYKVVVDKNFSKIYTAENLDGNFHSCMNNKNAYGYYTDCVDASAAYVVDSETGKIKARCVIYNKVYTADGKVHRYADRTYYTDEAFGHYLIGYLIKNDIIDLHKKVGAGCHDTHMILDNEDCPLADPRIAIDCIIPREHKFSYADTFIYYSAERAVATNDQDMPFTWSSTDYNFRLDSTGLTYNGVSSKLTKNEVTSRTLSDFISK